MTQNTPSCLKWKKYYIWKNIVRTTVRKANDSLWPYNIFCSKQPCWLDLPFFHKLRFKMIFFSCLDFETKKIIEGGICQKSAEVTNETLGNKLHICFTWLVCKTFRTSLKNGFKKVGRPLTQNTPRPRIPHATLWITCPVVC